jgi:ribonuclease PH
MRRERSFDELRPYNVTKEYIKGESNSVLFELGLTKVLCVTTIKPKVPRFLEGKKMGWITAEYGMLPRSSQNRILRERVKLSGRSYEIQRLVGRSLRASCDLSILDGYTIIVDVDVIQADGGTRVASINGGMISLYLLLRDMVTQGQIEKLPIVGLVGAVSVGKLGSEIILDPDYEEDANLDVDTNIVMNEELKLIEISAITEGNPFSLNELKRMLSLARKGIKEIIEIERETLSLTLA